MKGQNKDAITGKFTKKEIPTQRAEVRMPLPHYEQLKLQCQKGEYIADKVRQAIAFYLEHHPVDIIDNQSYNSVNKGE